MKKHLLICCALAVLLPAMLTAAESRGPGFLDFGQLSPGSSAGEFVEVRINSNLLAMAARLAEKVEPEAAKLLTGLRSVRVNVIGLTEENRARMRDLVSSVRARLDKDGWERVVAAIQDAEDVGVYLKTAGADAVQGLVVTVLHEEKQAVLVNVDGDIRPEQIATLGEKLGIDPLKKLGKSIKN